MGWNLIAASTEPSWIMETLGVAWTVILVLIGVNLVILVHEWGHFIVARMCGVKCEKFYVWFDIFGWKLFKFRWGDTEYGLGVLPLGGYVKMLGQEDNPARLREELERAKIRQAAEESGEPIAEEDAGDYEPIDIAAAEAALFDPQSYLAKNVPQRMAIIVAGVVMNVVFAFVAATIAYSIGVEQTVCAVGNVLPGEAAWRADFQIDDQIVEIGGKPSLRFMDLNRAIAVGDDIDSGVPMVVSRRTDDGERELIELRIQPDRDKQRGLPTIGIASGNEPWLYKAMPVYPGSPAALAEPRFQAGDKVVEINGTEIASYADIHALQAQDPDRPFTVTIERQAAKEEQTESTEAQRLTIVVPPAPMRRLGLVMAMGPITAIQANSPAAAADPPFLPGDVITSISDDQGFAWDGDPMTLPNQLRQLRRSRLNAVGPPPQVTVTVNRPGENEGESTELAIPVPLRPTRRYSYAVGINSPVTVPALGIAYRVGNKIQAIVPGGPAEAAGMKPGQKVAWAEVIAPDLDDLTAEQLGTDKDGIVAPGSRTLKFNSAEASWAILIHGIQDGLPGTRVKLGLEDKSEVELEPAPIASDNWYYSERGLVFAPATYMETAESIPDSLRLGTRETVGALTMIFSTVKSLGRGQVSPKKLSGPVGIVRIAYNAASRGPSKLLIFLCLISANLAVINILPIPVLDGGHIMFLTYEGITRKPPSEKVHIALSYMGLLMLLALMVWVMWLDIARLFGVVL